MLISIIIPVLNEKGVLEQKCGYFKQLAEEGRELIFVDGGSSDGSLEFLRQTFSNVISCSAGRARQMNAGAAVSKGDYLIFLHVDTMFQQESLRPFINTEAQWGYFNLKLSSPRFLFRLIERSINLRSRIFKIATGDQTLFFKRDFFNRLGGFGDLELMEDLDISRRAKRAFSPSILSAEVLTSARRWERHGVIKTILYMWHIQLLFKLGVSTKRLNKMYLNASWWESDDK